MKPYLGEMLFAAGLRMLDEGDTTQGLEYIRQADSTLRYIDTRQESIAHIASIWVMQHEPERRDERLRSVIGEMTTKLAWHDYMAAPFKSGAHAAWAFESYGRGQWSSTAAHALQAIRHNMRAARNKGLLSIWARSTVRQITDTQDAPPLWSSSTSTDPECAHIAVRIKTVLGRPVEQLEEVRHIYPDDKTDKIFRVWAGGKIFIARLARQGEVAQSDRALTLAAAAGVPVPDVVAHVRASGNVPGLMIETHIEGQLLGEMVVTQSQFVPLKAQLLRHLAKLRGITFERFSALSPARQTLSTFDSYMDALKVRVLWQIFSPSLPLDTVPTLAQAFEFLCEHGHPGVPSLVHADLNPSNILVHDGCISGIIDWETAEASDPLRDIAELYVHLAHVWSAPVIDRTFEDNYGPMNVVDRQRLWAYTLLMAVNKITHHLPKPAELQIALLDLLRMEPRLYG